MGPNGPKYSNVYPRPSKSTIRLNPQHQPFHQTLLSAQQKLSTPFLLELSSSGHPKKKIGGARGRPKAAGDKKKKQQEYAERYWKALAGLDRFREIFLVPVMVFLSLK